MATILKYGRQMRVFSSLCVAIAVLTIIPAQAETPASRILTPAAIAALIVKQSRDEYYATGHPCACPDDVTRNGRSCGNMSAYIRPGGAHPLCSPADVTPGMIADYQASHGTHQ